MPIEITPKIIQEYAEGYMNKPGRKHLLHSAYDITVEKYRSLKVHANGEVPVKIINERRPSEPIDIKEYRECIYVPITKGNITKIISSLSKIRRSTDWSIKWPEKKISSIKKEEEIWNYIENKFPYNFNSLTNWIFSVFLKSYLIDANAIILVLPINIEKEPSEYYKPYPFIFNSPQVLKYEPNDYVIIVSNKKCDYNILDDKGSVINTRYDGLIVHYIDTNIMYTFSQTDENMSFYVSREYIHNLGFLPAFKMPGLFFEACENDFINESRISGTVPHLDEMARLYSDLQAEIVQHVHSEKWIYLNTHCTHCNGLGKKIISGIECICESCNGIGKVPTSPYMNIILTPPDPIAGENTVPTPPAGYIQKTDVAEMCQKLNDMINEHSYKSLASVNMQFLDQTPLNESGTAKEVDKDELNNFVHSIAEDIVYAMDRIIFISNEYRYKDLITDQNKRLELLPEIPVPEKFDLLSSTYLIDEIEKAKRNNINNLIIATLEIDYALKKFYNDPEIAKIIALVFELDPLPALTDDAKMMRLQNNGITQIDYVISSNIIPFIKRAVREDVNFIKKTYEEQMVILNTYANEKLNQTTAEGNIRTSLNEEEVIIE